MDTPCGHEGSEGSQGSEGSKGGGRRLENKKGASLDKTLKPPWRTGKTGKPGLRPVGNTPLLVLAHHLSPGGGTFTAAI